MRRRILQNGTLGMQLAAVAAVMVLGWRPRPRTRLPGAAS